MIRLIDLYRVVGRRLTRKLIEAISDHIGSQIFARSPLRKKNVAEIAKQVRSRYEDDSLLIWFWPPIAEILPTNANADALHSYVEPLNRHVVMHGLNFEHGTKRHSLKALSYLQYVSEFRDDVKSYPKEC